MERRSAGIHLGWVAFGWFVAAAITATILFALIVVGIVPRDTSEPGLGSLVAVASGFLVGGFSTARRATDQPLVFGCAIGAFSLVAWLVANLLARAVTGTATWDALPLGQTVALLVVQVAGATLGAWVAHSRRRTG